MKATDYTSRLAALTFALTVAAAPLALAEDEAPADWPCEQGYVSEISPAVVWDGPSVEGMRNVWRKDAEIDALVKKLTARRTDQTTAEQLIDEFAKAQPKDQHDQRLTLLFAGVLQVLNHDRSKLNRGIVRYAEDQQQRAEKLGDHLAEIADLENRTDEGAVEKLEQKRHDLEFEQRVFDERERSIPFLCTRPRAVEQRIGDLARAIAYQLN